MDTARRAQRPLRPISQKASRLSLAAALLAGAALAGCQQKTPDGAIGPQDVQYALDVLKAAPDQGFAPGAFGERQLLDMRPLTDADRARRDQLLRAALIAYARAEHGLTIPAGQWPAAWGMRPAAYDAAADLTQAVREHRFRQWLDSQPTPLPEYAALQKAYVAYAKLAANGGWPGAPAGARQGASGPAVDALRQRLAAEDPSVQAQGPYDADLAAAVSRFQAAHGLPTTGQVDAATLQELNVPAAARAAQIRADLERLRWLPRDEPGTRVDVNTAAQTFDFYQDGRPAMHMLAAAGKPDGDETPMLASKIDSVVLNPAWHVPDEIAQKELYPKEQASPGYFAAHDFTTENGHLVQKAGPQSSLGVVKFDFKNPYAVYLHDTPAKAAFSRNQRAVSHGCVRLEQAVAFAKLLLGQEAGWAPDRVDQVIASRETTTVPLKHPVPVRLMYLTAFPEGGRIAFRQDVYGWDGQVLQLLDRAAQRSTAQAAPPARNG